MSEPARYCTYCHKRDHDTNECWSTRAVTPHTTPVFNFPGVSFKEAAANLKMSDELRDELHRICGVPKEKL